MYNTVLQVLSDATLSEFCMSITLCNRSCKKQHPKFIFKFPSQALKSRLPFSLPTSLPFTEGGWGGNLHGHRNRVTAVVKDDSKGDNEERCTECFDNTHIGLQGERVKKTCVRFRHSEPRTSRYWKNYAILLASLMPSCKLNTALTCFTAFTCVFHDVRLMMNCVTVPALMEWFRKGAANTLICLLDVLTRGVTYICLPVIVCNILQKHKKINTKCIYIFFCLSRIDMILNLFV